jgi:hypothetical protein
MKLNPDDSFNCIKRSEMLGSDDFERNCNFALLKRGKFNLEHLEAHQMGNIEEIKRILNRTSFKRKLLTQYQKREAADYIKPTQTKPTKPRKS